MRFKLQCSNIFCTQMCLDPTLTIYWDLRRSTNITIVRLFGKGRVSSLLNHRIYNIYFKNLICTMWAEI